MSTLDLSESALVAAFRELCPDDRSLAYDYMRRLGQSWGGLDDEEERAWHARVIEAMFRGTPFSSYFKFWMAAAWTEYAHAESVFRGFHHMFDD